MNLVIPGSNLPRIVIAGGGFGGINLAQSLAGKPFQVVMFDKNNYHTFQPLLYQVATGGLEPDSIAFPLRKVFEEQENFYFRMAEVIHIDAENKTIDTTIGSITYDYLVICTGSKTNFFGLDHIEELAVGMKTIPEALDLRSLILQNFEKANYEINPHVKSALMKFVIVGGGPTGVETAGALAELKRFVLPADYPELDMRQMEIHLIEASGKVLNGMSEASSKDALKALENLGVHVWLNTYVKDFDGQRIVTNKTFEFQANTVLWAAGVVGCTPEGMHAESITKGKRILVDEFNRVKGYEEIFALGDVACMIQADYPNGHPQVAPVAMQMGKNLGYNLMSLRKGAPLRPFSYFDKGSMATVGRNKAVVDFRKMHMKGILAWLAWMFVHLLFLIGFRNRLIVFANWVYSYFTYDKGTRLIIRPYRNPKAKEAEPLSV